MFDPDHPVIVQGDGSILVDAHHPRYEAAREALSPYAELVSAPEHVHTYRLSGISIWNAMALGRTATDVKIDVGRYAQHGVPGNVLANIDAWASRHGRIVLEAGDPGLVLRCSDAVLAREVSSLEGVARLLGEPVGEGAFAIDPLHRGEIKWALVKVGFPVEDRAGFSKGDPMPFRVKDGEGFQVRDYQRGAAEAFAASGGPEGGHGVVVLPCGAGKTLVGLLSMERVGASTLILVTSEAAAEQWAREIRERTDLPADAVGLYTGSTKVIRPVTIATYSVLTRRKAGEFTHLALFRARPFGLVVYDEVHLLPAPVFRMTASLQAVRRLGLTATLIREDGKEEDVFALIGPKRYDIPWKVLERASWIAEAECVEVRVPASLADRVELSKVEPAERFRVAASSSTKDAAVRALVERHKDQPTLVLGVYLDALRRLAAELGAPLVCGDTPPAKRQELYDAFRRGELRTLVLSRVGSFAIDLPSASVAIEVSGTFGSRQEEAQRLGRVLRPKDETAYFYTVVLADTVEQDAALRRQRFLAEQGYRYRVETTGGAGGPGVSGASRSVTADYAIEVRALEPAVRLRLAGKVGLPAPKDDTKLADAIARALATPAGAERVLASLSPDGRELARLRSTSPTAFPLKELSAWARDELGWTKPRFTQAHAELLSCGLHRSTGSRHPADLIAVLQAFVAGQDATQDAWSAGVLPDARPVVPVARRVGLLVAYAFLDPVRRTRAGDVNAHWLERAFTCFAPIGTSIHHLLAEVNLLVNMGVLAAQDGAEESDRLRVVPAALERLDASPADLASAALQSAGSSTLEHARGLLVGLSRLRRNGHVGPFPLPTVQSALREVDTLALWEACRAPVEQYTIGALAHAAGLLRGFGMLTVEGGADGLRVSEAPSSAPDATEHPERPPARWIVQPNFEILVPEDVGPHLLGHLGGIADLIAVDRVARFRLTQESVARAVLLPGGVGAAIERLRTGALHGLPDNVEETVVSWGRRAAVVRPYRGSFLVAGSAEQAALLRARPELHREIAPGVFHVASAPLAFLLKELADEGHAVAPVIGEGLDLGRNRPQETASVQAERLRKGIEKTAAATSPELRRRAEEERRLKAEAELAASRAQRAASAGKGAKGGAEQRLRRTLVEVSRTWPLVACVVAVRPDLLRTVLTVQEETLRSAEESGSPRAAERFLAEVGERMGLLQRGKGPAAVPVPASASTRPLVQADDDLDAADADEDLDHRAPAEPSPGDAHRLALGLDWKTLAPGPLEDILELAAEAGLCVEILYVNAAGEKKPRTVQPEAVYRQKRRVWLDATERDTDASHTFALDRIAAIRTAPG